MASLILGLILFLGVHSSAIFFAQARHDIIAKRGRIFWQIPYTLLSLIGLIVIIWGYGAARENPTILYQAPTWASHVAALLMAPAMIFMVSSNLRGKIAATLKHPQLAAVKVWALAHLISNGDLASVVLFGSFLVWAVIDRISLKKRVARGFANNNPGGPVRNDIIAVVVGLALYVLFIFWAHQYLFGVSPIS